MGFVCFVPLCFRSTELILEFFFLFRKFSTNCPPNHINKHISLGPNHINKHISLGQNI